MKGEPTIELIIFVVIVLLSQSIFLFTNAKKHHHNYWLWGILGLIQAPFPTIVYLLFVRRVLQRER